MAEADPDYVVLSREGAEADGAVPDARVSSDPDVAVVDNAAAPVHMVEGLISPKSGNYLQLTARGSDLDHVLAMFVVQARFIASQTEEELRANAEANGGQIRFPDS